MGTGVGRALELTAEAAHAAGQIASRTAAMGFTGIAQRMGGVQRMIQQLHGHVAAVGNAVNEARTPVGKAPDQLSPKDTIDLLSPVEEQIGAIQGGIGAAMEEVGRIHTQTAGALRGGQPGPMLQRLDAIRQVLQTVGQRATTAKQHVESHTAARMRRQGLSEGVLVLNNVTCGNRGFDNDWPATCDKLLPPILPAGSRLTVWATADSGQTWWTKTYVGTGEGIKT